MKNIFIGLLFLAVTFSFAQEAGKVGELLKNEASKTEIESPNLQRTEARTGNNSGFRNQNKNNGSLLKNPGYQWNNEYGYSEVFLRIPEQGIFSVELGDQFMANNSGKFRFFDLPSGRIPISIYENGYLLYRTTLNVRNNSRLVLDFFTNKGLYLLDSYPVQNQSYGFNNWNDVWNNPYGNQSNNWNNGGSYANVMDNNSFSDFLSVLHRNARFDDDRLSMIRQQMRTTMFTSQQIQALVKEMSFDKNKLSLAKSIFNNCVDKHKYFIVCDAFDFESSKRELMDFVSNS